MKSLEKIIYHFSNYMIFSKECVIEVADNSKLKGEFRFFRKYFLILRINILVFRMALDIVEGYVIDTSKPWCAPYAR